MHFLPFSTAEKKKQEKNPKQNKTKTDKHG